MEQAEADFEQALGKLHKLETEIAQIGSDSRDRRTGSNYQFLLEKTGDLVALLATVRAEMNLFVEYADGNMLVRDELFLFRRLLTMYIP
jgi:2-keto-3-deoxy-galactonokinase